jgi:acetoacetyl-CoA reductase
MTRIANVTGGTRGLGAAISHALNSQGCRVAAVYHGNDKTAREFEVASGIPIYKWDVADFNACKSGIEEVVRLSLAPASVDCTSKGKPRHGQKKRNSRAYTELP